MQQINTFGEAYKRECRFLAGLPERINFEGLRKVLTRKLRLKYGGTHKRGQESMRRCLCSAFAGKIGSGLYRDYTLSAYKRLGEGANTYRHSFAKCLNH